jgi:Protein of unknown function (DUF4235)
MTDIHKKEDFGTRVFNTVTTMAASFIARKSVTFAWTKITGKKPPTNPEDPAVAMLEALSWSVVTGVAVAALRLLAIRAVASRRTLSAADREPANAADG